LRLFVQVPGHEFIDQGICDERRELRLAAAKGHPDEARVPNHIDLEAFSEGSGQLTWPMAELLELGASGEVQEPDDPICERSTLEHLEVGLELRLRRFALRIVANDLVELDDPRLLPLDSQDGRGREHRWRGNDPDARREYCAQADRDNRPRVLGDDLPVVPEVGLGPRRAGVMRGPLEHG